MLRKIVLGTLLLALMGFTVGCDEETKTDADPAIGSEAAEEEGGELPAEGSCADSCGEESLTGGCFCNDGCQEAGNCCEDYVDICVATEGAGGEGAQEEGGEATAEEGGEATEEEGGEGEEEGACFPEDEAFECNPFDSSTCDESMDEACDVIYSNGSGELTGFQCYADGNNGKPGQPCGEELGSYCENGLTCSVENVCVVICCSADECEEGQVCETPASWSILEDSTVGTCQWPMPQGMTNTDCGDPAQGEDVVSTDCTAYGDTESMCVFSNHCMCSEGFECEEVFEGLEPGAKECAPGSSCVPEFVAQEGTTGTSCGQPNQMLTPVDCTAQGDTGAYCIFGNHCKCSEGFVCGDPDTGELSGSFGECVAGEICIPAE